MMLNADAIRPIKLREQTRLKQTMCNNARVIFITNVLNRFSWLSKLNKTCTLTKFDEDPMKLFIHGS